MSNPVTPLPVVSYLGDAIGPVCVRRPGKETHVVYSHDSRRNPDKVYLVFAVENFDTETGHAFAKSIADMANQSLRPEKPARKRHVAPDMPAEPSPTT